MRTSILQLCMAVPFLTANALVITESMHGGLGTGYFIAARLTDVAVGSTIGLLGTILLWRRFSAKRLPEHMREVIRLEGQFMERLLAGQQIDGHQLRVSLVRLRDAYDKALGDFPKAKADTLWPAISGVQHLSYYLLSAQAHHRPPSPVFEQEINHLRAFFVQAEQSVLLKVPPAVIECRVFRIIRESAGNSTHCIQVCEQLMKSKLFVRVIKIFNSRYFT